MILQYFGEPSSECEENVEIHEPVPEPETQVADIGEEVGGVTGEEVGEGVGEEEGCQIDDESDR